MRPRGFYFGTSIPDRRVVTWSLVILSVAGGVLAALCAPQIAIVTGAGSFLAIAFGYLARPEPLIKLFVSHQGNPKLLAFTAVFPVIYRTISSIFFIALVLVACVSAFLYPLPPALIRALCLSTWICSLSMISMVVTCYRFAKRFDREE